MTIVSKEAWRKPWVGLLAPYGENTSDARKRTFPVGSLTNRDLPLHLMLQIKRSQGHEGAITVGTIDSIEYTDEGVYGRGRWLDPEACAETERAITIVHAGIGSVSVDLTPDVVIDVEDGDEGDKRVVYRKATIAGATLVALPAFGSPRIRIMEDDGTDTWGEEFAITGTTSWRSMPAQPREVEYNADEAFKRILAWADGNDAKARTMFLWYDPSAAEGTRDRFRLPIGDIVSGRAALNFHAIYAAAALVSGAHGGLPTVSDQEKQRLRETISAIYKRLAGLYGDPALEAPWDKRAKMPDVASTDAVTASAYPVAPPDAWLQDPKLSAPTVPLRVDPSGRVYGHLALWGTCHRTVGQVTGSCQTPPRSTMNYGMFHRGEVLTASGSLVRVGAITVDTGHAGIQRGSGPAAAHYDDTGKCAAVVRAGEDEHGIWVAGSMVPGCEEDVAAILRRSPLSGDWRRDLSPDGSRGPLELIAALAVNVPGFPHVRIAFDGDGDRDVLIASGEPVVSYNSGMDGDSNSSSAEETQEAGSAAQAPVIDVQAMIVDAAKLAAEQLRREQDEKLAVADRMERLAAMGAAAHSRDLDSRMERLNRLRGQ